MEVYSPLHFSLLPLCSFLYSFIFLYNRNFNITVSFSCFNMFVLCLFSAALRVLLSMLNIKFLDSDLLQILSGALCYVKIYILFALLFILVYCLLHFVRRSF